MDRILHDVDNAHKILQLTSDTLILVDKNGTCLDIDPHSDLWFLQEDRLLGKNLFNLLPDHTFQKLLPDFRRVTQQGITVNRNYRLPLEGGETYYFKCIMQPYDGDKVLCQYRDITARSNVKLQLERTNYELKEIQKAAQIGQWKYSSREKTFYYRGYNGIVCTEEERSINFQDYYETILSEDLPAVNTWMEANRRELLKEYIEYRILLEGQVYYMRQQCYLRNEEEDGNIVLEGYIQKIMVESEDFSPIIVSIEWDITQLELMRRELIESKEKAETSDKLKSAFLANMSHEIRTPLNAIVGFSRIISESDNAEERREYYEIVDANNERLLQLINEILDLSKIESGIVEFTYGPVRLHTLCKEIHDAHVFRCPQGVELRFDSPDEALSIHSDKNRIFQVFSNLIGNAFKFTTEGSVSYGYKQEGERVVFYVKDTGLGIEPEKLGRVFQRFAKLNNFAQGTGLGLSICKTIIERLGGEIAVSSEVGTGTTFTFWLPLENVIQDTETGTNSHLPGEAVGTQPSEVLPAKEDTPRPKEETTEKEEDLRTTAVETEKATILIAEDTDSNFDLLNAILGRKYRLVRARDGMEAVTMYDEVNPDLILMDIKMPNLDGLEATRIIRQLSAEVPIIAQSAYAYEHDRNAAEEAGCNDFISKPIAQEKLKEKIKKWLK
ncbi:ATP-binding protein [Bacteroides fragilis]|jgi:signal transduction histidine kinase